MINTPEKRQQQTELFTVGDTKTTIKELPFIYDKEEWLNQPKNLILEYCQEKYYNSPLFSHGGAIAENGGFTVSLELSNKTYSTDKPYKSIKLAEQSVSIIALLDIYGYRNTAKTLQILILDSRKKAKQNNQLLIKMMTRSIDSKTNMTTASPTSIPSKGIDTSSPSSSLSFKPCYFYTQNTQHNDSSSNKSSTSPSSDLSTATSASSLSTTTDHIKYKISHNTNVPYRNSPKHTQKQTNYNNGNNNNNNTRPYYNTNNNTKLVETLHNFVSTQQPNSTIEFNQIASYCHGCGHAILDREIKKILYTMEKDGIMKKLDGSLWMCTGIIVLCILSVKIARFK